MRIFFIGLAVFFISCSPDSSLEWNEETSYRWAELDPGFFGETGFKQLSATTTGIQAVNLLSDEQVVENQNLLNGSGVAAGDIDGDGLVDLYFARLEGSNKLYKNLGGFQFVDITESAGVAHTGYSSTGVALADVDGDYDLDLLVTSLTQQNVLYLNDGKGHFDISTKSGLGSSNGSTTMALADIDGDSDLDLYITNYKKKTVKDLFSMAELAWENTVSKEGDTFTLIPPFDDHFRLIPGTGKPDRRELGTKDELYVNNGNGRFEKVEDTKNRFFDSSGAKKGLEPDWGLTAKFQDLNTDGLPDLYVCNDFWTPDRIWINQGDGRFREIDKMALRKQSFSSMGVDFSDINRDGFVDIFVTEMLGSRHQQRMRQMVTYTPFVGGLEEMDSQPQYMQNTLHLNRGDHTFAEIASYSGIEATGWSWATNFLDVDLDGYEDLLINTGHARDVLDLDTQRSLSQFTKENDGKGYILEYPSLQLSNVALQNNGDLTFTKKGTEWGFGEADISHGMAIADFDNDGDIDIVTNRLNREPAIFENRSTAARIAVRLKGEQPNTRSIGAKVKLQGGPIIQQKEVASGGSYLSGSDPLVVFAAREENKNHVLKITWPNGKVTVLDSIQANRIYEIDQAESQEEKESIPSLNSSEKNKKLPLFEDVSDRIDYVHYEEKFNDFEIQPLLPIKLSQLGPGIAWIDVDQDNDDDLFLGTGKGGRLGFFENNGAGKFESRELGGITGKASGDLTGIIGWAEQNSTHILVGNSNYEQGFSNSTSAYHYRTETTDESNIIRKNKISGSYSTTGPLAAADYDGDEDIDLFVGGRFVPTQYPVDASSRLFTNVNGEFVLDKKNSEALKNVGLVTGAVFTDYDRDEDQDLLISTEWGSIKLFRNINGIFREITKSVGLNQFKGWWNGITTGDFNGDGWPDFIATNSGENRMFARGEDHPLKVYYDDFDRDQRVEIVEAYYEPNMSAYVPRRNLNELNSSLPVITRNVRSYKDFANSDLEKLLGTQLQNIPSKYANTGQHMVFINQNEGRQFSAHSLPVESQFTAAFSAGVADFNSDGNEDLFLSQNLFSFPRVVPRQDAGRGLWLKGDGQGGFEVVKGNQSGIKVYGEQRGAALSDFNKDGKVDLAIMQNQAPLKLFLNQHAKSGLTIHLVGPERNRDGIGSSVRLVYKDGSKGPRREIQAGSGYWSQNSATQILGAKKPPESIEITWFDGTIQTVDVDRSKHKYQILYPEEEE